MKEHRKYRISGIALMLLAAAVLLHACGNTDKKSTHPASALAGATATGIGRCTSCHTVVAKDWLTSRHANLDPAGNLYSVGVPTSGQVTAGSGCTSCHDPNGDSNDLTDRYTGYIARPVVGCETCHGPGSLHADAGGSGAISLLSGTYIAMSIGSTSVSGQFVMCTNCHELLDTAGTTTNSSPVHSATTPTGTAYTITDTHFATFGDFTGAFDGATGLNTRNISGYALNYSDERVCTSCHNPHLPANINQEWTLSAHADRTANFDGDPATKDRLGYFSGAWAHYNWGNAANYRACQRCHTTTGFSLYADAHRAGDDQRVLDIQHGVITLLSSSPTGSFKPEMLKCNGCHIDNRGTLRNPGAITANYDYPLPLAAGTKPYAVASYAYPDVKGSNVCMACHVGRESGDTVKGLNDPDLVNITLQTAGTNSFFDFSTQGFINSHYLTAGGTVFGATGFHFEGRSYANPATYRHVYIGTPSVPNTGTNGPCVGCHMSRPGGAGDHLFLPVTRSTTDPGHIDGIASEICIYCHTVSGAGGLEDLINERKEEYHEAIEAAIYVLDKRGFYFRPANPYIFSARKPNDPNATVAVSQGGVTVNRAAGLPLWSTGTTTVYTGTAVAGTSTSADYFKVNADGHYYRIEDATDTTLTLREPYSGPTVTNASFTIIQGRSGGKKGWLTAAGSGVVPAPVADTDKTGNATGRYNLGAAFNLNLLEHDPGGYVHNRIYAKRLLYDSIDWADDNVMNYSVGVTLSTLPIDGSAPSWRAGAMKYLLPSGVLGIAAERP